MLDHDDDRPVGHVLSRRAAMRLIGSGTAASLWSLDHTTAAWAALSGQAPATAPGCIVRPEQTEGPYFVDKQLKRIDIREGRKGDVLNLAVTVLNAANGQCRPLPGAIVDVWQCDAKGVYSGVSDPSFDTRGQTYLRGVQTAGNDGIVRFTTIYPGWYPGRTVHIHFKIRTQAPAGGAYEFTSQWYFEESLNDQVLAGADYARPGRRDTTNAADGIYRNGGDQLLLAPVRKGTAMTATYAIGLDLSNADVGRADGFGPGRGRRGGQ